MLMIIRGLPEECPACGRRLVAWRLYDRTDYVECESGVCPGEEMKECWAW